LKQSKPEEEEKATEPEKSADPPKRRSLAEQFGYGVVLKTEEPAKPPILLAAPAPQVKKGGFIGVEVGDGDFHRLRQRKSVIAAGA